MKKIITLSLVILMLVFVMGCTSQTSTSGTVVTGRGFAGGTEGVTIQFVTGAPPEKILDKDQPFGVSVRVENKGGYDIENAADTNVRITGFDPGDFGVTDADMKKDSSDPLRGVKLDTGGNVIPGSLSTIDFPASGKVFSHQRPVAGQVVYNIKADVCSLYGTIANSELCVLEDLLGTTGQETTFCKVSEQKGYDNSGAPLQITSFIESVASATKVNFLFKIEHKGTGKLYEQKSKCEETFAKRDKVHVKVDTGVTGGLTCSGLQNGVAGTSSYEGDVTLLNNLREISCTQTIPAPKDFKKVVRIDLTYDYKQSVTKELVVQHVGG